LDRFEKQLEELKSQSNSGSNSKDNGSDDKDEKISQPEAQNQNTPTKENIQTEQTKRNNEYNENLNQAEKGNATLEEKAEAIKKSGSMVGEETPEQKSRREKLEAELTEKDSELANQALLGRIENNLKTNNLTLEELPSEIQADYQKIKDKMVKDIEARINEFISKTGIKKKIESLKKEIENLANASQKRIRELKEKLLKIIHSKNKYYQEYKQQARSLLTQLENRQVQKPSDSKFPVG